MNSLLTNKWFLIITVVLILALVGSASFITYKVASAEKEIAIADVKKQAYDEKEKLLKEDQKRFFDSFKEAQKKNTAIASKQTEIEKEKAAEKEKSKEQVVEVLKPDKELEEVAKEAKLLLELEPEIINNKLAFSKEQVQLVTALKLDYQALQRELEKTQEQLVLEKERTAILSEQLERSTQTIESTNKALEDLKVVMEAYKSAAKKSKWKIAKEVTIRAAEIGIAAYVGSKF